MSYDGDTNTVLKGVTHGAVDFLIKPVRVAELSNMWQHVVRKRRSASYHDDWAHGDDPGPKRAGSHSSAELDHQRGGDASTGPSPESKKRTNDDKALPQSTKRPRVHWSSQMHSQFVAAVSKLGVDKAVPKKILELMGVEGLTRENVASHLQKYRLYLRKAATIDGADTEPGSTAAATPAQAQVTDNHKTAPAAQPATVSQQPESQYIGYTGAQTNMIMNGMQQAQPHIPQRVYSGVPASYMSQSPWQPPMMCAPHMQQSHYMTQIQRSPWQQPMVAHQQIGVPVDHRQFTTACGTAASIPPSVPPNPPYSTGHGHSAVGHPNTHSMTPPSTLPPLGTENMLPADDFERDFPVKAEMQEMIGIGALCGSAPGDGGDDNMIPDEMDDFLSILAKDEHVER